jgi:hypothetical protein
MDNGVNHMTGKFERSQFNYHGGYLTYGQDNRFVARFKRRGVVTKSDYVRLLCKYYNTDSYFNRVKTEAPGQILMNDGYISYDLINKKIMVAK